MSNLGENMYDRTGWVAVDCKTSDALLAEGNLRVSSSLNDIRGDYGPGVIYTEWFDPATDKPVLRDYRWSEDGRDCEHLVPVGVETDTGETNA